ncbi:MAG: hypothetical protein HZB11_00425 [Candidatus Yonathbacteria bacterium]|nr:hypothetical protein [Candidatus Yonathbacteria bacterium]
MKNTKTIYVQDCVQNVGPADVYVQDTNLLIRNLRIRKRGAVLLIAILVSGVALAVGIGVYKRIYKELLFASFWKQTQVAFAAADSGLECALYWDLHPPVSGNASCFGGASFAWSTSTPVLPQPMVVSGGCVNVIVTKTGTAPIVTTIESRGYNTCDTANSRRVERGLGASY